MSNLIEIKSLNGYPFLHLTRDLTNFDLAPVTEEANSILFILGDDPWEEINGELVIKLRFRTAIDLENDLKELKKSNIMNVTGKHFLDLSEICRVHSEATLNAEEKDSIEKNHYIKSLEKLNKAITQFNLTSFMLGMQQGSAV